jgi:ribonucleoside-diphosphate reductase alpha chain
MSNIIDLTGIDYDIVEFLEKEDSKFETADIEVEDTHYYIMADNIVSHNTTSLMTQTTSGIEPVFKPAYMRRRKINPNDKDTKAVFIDDVGDHWEEYPIFHPKFLKWAKIKGHDVEKIKIMKADELSELVKQSPYYKASSEDVNWVEKVKMQGAIQKWVDHSISVTVNLPAETTEDVVGNVYMAAWESGCKGVTVYREGSRSGVLVSNQEKKQQSLTETMREHSAPKRPKIIDCDVVRFSNQHDKWIGFVGLLDKRPYEIFTGKTDLFPLPASVETGKIKKVKDNGNGSRYDFVYIDKDGYEQEVRGLNRVFDKEYWNIAKTFSGLLRHGMPIVNVYELVCSLKFDGDGFNTWKSGLKRMIKKYIDDDTVAKGETCPNCHSDHIVYQDGCLSCKSCGWQKCSA